MTKKLNRFFLTGILFCLALLMVVLLIPRSYPVQQFAERSGTQYWYLPTGSKIGYSLKSASDTSQLAPVIYLHGGPGGLITDGIIASLLPLQKMGHDLYFYDQIGSGHSARLKDIRAYTPQRHLEDLSAIIKKIDAPKVILLGHSWGAVLATRYLAIHPERLEKVILTGPGPILPTNAKVAKKTPPDSLDIKSPEFSNQQGNQVAYNWRSKATLYFAYIFGKKLASDQEADAFFTHLNNALQRSTVKDTSALSPSSGGGGYYAYIMTSKHLNQVVDQRQILNQNQVPILILRGQYDNQVWGFCAEYLELIPNVNFELIKGAGHSINKEQPKIYLDHISAFLAE